MKNTKEVLQRHDEKNIEFSSKIESKFLEKLDEIAFAEKVDPKKGAWGRHFRRKTEFLDDLGDPGEALGEALGRILERKFSVEKKVEKRRGGCLGG